MEHRKKRNGGTERKKIKDRSRAPTFHSLRLSEEEKVDLGRGGDEGKISASRDHFSKKGTKHVPRPGRSTEMHIRIGDQAGSPSFPLERERGSCLELSEQARQQLAGQKLNGAGKEQSRCTSGLAHAPFEQHVKKAVAAATQREIVK